MCIRRGWVLSSLAVWFAAGGLTAAQTHARKNVLMLNSYHAGYEWTDDLLRGVKSEFRGAPYEIELWVEYMDVKRHLKDRAGDKLLGDILRDKFAPVAPDVVISTDDAALQFLIGEHGRLFPRTPVVFCGVNDPALAARADRRRFTGILEVFGSEPILDIALGHHPNTKYVYVVSDNSETGLTQRRTYQEAARTRPALDFRFLDGRVLSFEEILRSLAEAPEMSLVITTEFALDRGGTYIPREESHRRIAAASPAPVYSPSISSLGQGIVGGSENGGFQHGVLAAKHALRILAGERPDRLPVLSDSENRYVFDAQQLQRWGIPLKSLPRGASLVNRRESFYEANRRLVWGVVLFIVLQTSIIAALAVNVSRRRRAETELASRSVALGRSNRELETANESLRAEMAARSKLEEQFRQAQKMEAVGRLAGGVAHDFNNLLTVITGYCRLLLARTAPDDPARRGVEEILRAGDRAAALTTQLLAFSRQQLLQPRVLDLNAVVASTEEMLHRLIGEDIDLLAGLCPGSAWVKADEGQMEQVIVNLAINARDAMPSGGKLSIRTARIDVDEAAASRLPGLHPGPHVVFEVGDTGLGMDQETLARIFEPFFTTKETGKGTGLGLSTVYGIVRQSGGEIEVQSLLGQGSTFRIYLPASEEHESPAQRSAITAGRSRGNETILLVEDEPAVRALAAEVLKEAGFRVLEAPSGADALALCDEPHEPIHLMLTDVVLPGMSGRELADYLRRVRPGTPVLFCSGYTDDIIQRQGALGEDIDFLPKPFTPESLVERARQALDRRSHPAS